MDTSDGYEGLDFALGEPGTVEDTRVADEAEQFAESTDELLEQTLERFDRIRTGQDQRAIGVIRASLAGASEAAGERVLERFAATIRSPDFCVKAENGDFVLGLSGCDTDLARKRIALMLKLVAMEPALGGIDAAFWGGVAPVAAGGSSSSARTARLACDLAAFQDSGHVEVIDW